MEGVPLDHHEPAPEDAEDEKRKHLHPTSKDVARLANVSRTTVSFVLNNQSDAKISEATKKRVLRAAEQLGYVPNRLASTLRSGRSDLVILPYFDWPYNPSSTSYLQELASQVESLGYTVMLRFIRGKDKHNLARKIAAYQPIGVIFSYEELSQSDVELLKRNGVRGILALQREPNSMIPTMHYDFSVIGEGVSKYLVSRGYKDIAVVVPQDPRIHDMGIERLEGIKRVGKKETINVEQISLGYNPTSAAQLARQWKQGQKPDAVFTYNDEYGMLLMSALQDAGFSIPADIALIGCDNLPLCEMLRPRLTSVNIDSSNQASDIAAYFDQLIKGQENNEMRRMKITYEIVERESC